MLITVILTVVSYVSMGLVGNWDPFVGNLPEDSTAEISGSGRIETVQEKPQTRSDKKTFTVKQEDVHVGKVMVKFTEEASVKVVKKTGQQGVLSTRSASAKLKVGLSSVDDKLGSLNATRIKRAFPYHPRFEARQRAKGLHLWYEIDIDTTAQLNEVCRQLGADVNIQVVEPVLKKIFRDIEGKKVNKTATNQLARTVIAPLNGGVSRQLTTRASRTSLPASTRSYENTPPVNDPMLLQQWHYYNYGQVMTPNGMTSIPGADIKLFDAWKINMGNRRVIVAVQDEGVQYDHPDLKTNMWINEAELNGRQGVDDDGNGYVDDIYGYNFASNNGAVISQNSWGHTKPDYYEQATLDAIDYFIEYAGKDENGNPLPNTPMVGGIVIFAAGNEGTDEKWYPGYYDTCLAVASIGPWYDKPQYTCFGSWVDIAAPGGSIADNGTEAAGVLSSVAGGKYSFMQGTSMACPHVSGVAALVLSEYGHEAYTPEMLRNRLLSGTTPWGEVGKEEYTNRMGIGLLNAAKAMAPDKGIAPKAITDLKVESIGYEFVRVTFTAPADEDNGGATSYELRYSPDSVTDGNFQQGTALFQTALAAGSREEIIVDRLKGFTKYQIAVKALDIWGNVSKISNVVEVTTKEAPSIVVSPDSIGLEIADVLNTRGESYFEVANTKGGDLRYSVNYAIRSEPNTNPSQFTDHIYNYDPYNANMGQGTFGSNGEERFLAATRFLVNSNKKFVLTNVIAGIYPHWTDGKDVSYTKTPFRLKVYKGGATPAEGKLLHDAEYCILFKDYFLLGGGADIDYRLNGAYRFEKGEHFWIVFDFEKGFMNPMKIHGGTESRAGNELYSTNDTTWTDINTVMVGDLKPNQAYRIFALSNQNNLPENLITLEPATGFVVAGEKQRVKVSVDARKVEEGNYTSTLFVSHNDPEKPVIQVPLTFTVDGHHSGIRSVKTVSFGDVVQGFSDTTRLRLYNDSLGILKIDTIICDKKQFTVAPSSGITILPGDSASVKLTFIAPGVSSDGTSSRDSVGLFMSKLNFKTNTPSGNYAVIMDAVSIERPIAKLDKTEETIELRMGETKEVAFVLKNEGKYRLDYRLEQDKTVDFDFLDAISNAKKYYGKREIPARPWTNLNKNDKKVMNITDQVKGLRNASFALPFTFSYYGVDYDTITIAGDGNIRMGTYKDYAENPTSIGRWAMAATIFPCHTNNKARITAVGGEALLKMEGDKVTIEYTKFGEAEATGNAETIRIQIVLNADGKIELKYKDFNEKPRKSGLNLGGVIGMSGQTPKEGLGVWLCREDKKTGNYVTGGTNLWGAEDLMIISQGDRHDTVYYKWTPPVIEYKKNTVITIVPEVIFAKEITPSSGNLMPGEEVTLRVKVGTDKNLKEGRYVRSIPVFTNDPENKEVLFKLNIDFKSEARPTLAQTELNFGKVGKNVTVSAAVPLRNLGGKPFKATARMADGSFFKVTPVDEKECAGLAAMEYDVEFTPTEEKVYEDRLVIDVEGGAPLTLNIKGEGVKAPRLEVVKAAETLKFQTDRTKEGPYYTDTAIIVRNIGEAPLDYSVMTTQWIQDLTPALRSGMDKSGYFWSDNLDDASGVQYEWIEENPIPFDPLHRIEGRMYFSKEIQLPWAFEYYGETFSKCYVNMSGMVYFNRDDITYQGQYSNAIEAPVLMIPNEGLVNGYIAALGGSFDRAKHSYEIVGEGDDAKIVFTWHSRPLFDPQLARDTNYVTFQTILYKDGGIKFQYKDVEKAWWRNRTVIGIENRKGTDGVNICNNETKYIRNGLAIFIKPGRMNTLKPGEEKKLRLRADASELWEVNGSDRFGETKLPYKGVVNVRSNDPMNHLNTTNIEMTVTGEARTEYIVDGKPADKMVFGSVLRSAYPKSHDPKDRTYSTHDKKYVKTILIKNTGTKTMNIHSEKQVTLAKERYYITDAFEYDVRSNAAKYISVAPSQSYQLTLRLDPSYVHSADPELSAPGAGTYIVRYPVTQKCGMKDSIKCRQLGYPYHASALIMGRPGYSHSYKVDTIDLEFTVADVPQEELSADNLVQKLIYDKREGNRSFAFDVQNRRIEDVNFWNTMHGFTGNANYEKRPIEQQANLDYSLSVENLTKIEFENLLHEQAGKPEPKVAASLRTSAGVPETLNEVSLPAAAVAARPSTRAEETTVFLDSLGYFNYDKRIGGYTALQGGTLTSYIRYQAGSEGFNLTHFTSGMSKLNSFPKEGYNVKIKVLLGSDARTADLVYSESFVPEISVFGEFTTIEHRLEKSVYIYPGQYFWIGLENTPNTVVQTINWLGSKNYPKELSENFMLEMGEYFDLAFNLTNNFMGWSIVAYSDEKVEGAQNWISLSKNEGSVAVGGKEQISVTVNPSVDLTEMSTRYARIRINSNDPYPFGLDSTIQSELKFKNRAQVGDSVNFKTYARNRNEVLVMMRMNQAPEFRMENRELTLEEKQDSTVMIYVTDVEGDRFDDLQVTLDSSVFAEALYGVAPETKLEKKELRGDTVCFAFTLRPGYESEGTHAYRFLTKDAKGNASEGRFVLHVRNLNRAPEAIGANAVVIRKEISQDINLNGLFRDLDRQKLAFTVELLQSEIATANVIDSVMTLFGWQVGEVQLKITAADPEGAAKTITYNVTVIAEDPARTSTEVSIYPNPVVDILNCGFALNKRADVVFRIFGTDGRLFYESGKQGYAPGKHSAQIQVDNLPGGMFILQYEVNGSVKDTRKFVK